MIARTVIRLLLVLTILASAVLRPPGTMLVLDGGTISYEICSGGGIETVTLAVEGETQEEIDLGCDFFAAQIGALLFDTPHVAPMDADITRLVALDNARLFFERARRSFNPPRAPPVS